VDRRLAGRIDRLHQVDLDPRRADAERTDVLIDVLACTAELTRHLEAELVDPERPQPRLARSADRDLLDAEHTERTETGFCARLHRTWTSPRRTARLRIIRTRR
jgi:hypothetical protein